MKFEMNISSQSILIVENTLEVEDSQEMNTDSSMNIVIAYEMFIVQLIINSYLFLSLIT